MFESAPPARGGAGVRRHRLGEPVAHVDRAAVDRLVCVSGTLELRGPSCVEGLGLAAVSVVDAEGLVLVCRSTGPITLRSGGQRLALGGEIGVVVGSREDGSLFDGKWLRCLLDGDVVRVRGMLRRHDQANRGYRGPAESYVMEAFGGLDTIDVAFEGRPKGMRTRDRRALATWAEGFWRPPPSEDTPRDVVTVTGRAPRPAHVADPTVLIGLAERAKARGSGDS